MAEDSSDNSPLILSVRQAIRGPKAVAVTWADGRVSVVCLWNEIDLPPSAFDTHSVAAEGDDVAVAPKIRVLDDMTGIIWPDRDVTVTAARLAELAAAQDADPLPPAVFSTWRASLGLDVGGAAKHLAVGEADIRAYEAGSRPTPRVIALLCREWLAGEETAYERDWMWSNYIMLREQVDRAYKTFSNPTQPEKDYNKRLSNAAEVLGWKKDSKRHSRLSTIYLPVRYKQLITPGPDGCGLSKWAAVNRLCEEAGLASPEATRKAISRRIQAIKKACPGDTSFDGILPSTRPGSKIC